MTNDITGPLDCLCLGSLSNRGTMQTDTDNVGNVLDERLLVETVIELIGRILHNALRFAHLICDFFAACNLNAKRLAAWLLRRPTRHSLRAHDSSPAVKTPHNARAYTPTPTLLFRILLVH